MTVDFLDLQQGVDYTETFTWQTSAGTPISLVGYTAKLQLRQRYDSAALVSLTHASGITLGGSAGTITFTISASALNAIANSGGVWGLAVYDSGGKATMLRAGTYFVKPGAVQ